MVRSVVQLNIQLAFQRHDQRRAKLRLVQLSIERHGASCRTEVRIFGLYAAQVIARLWSILTTLNCEGVQLMIHDDDDVDRAIFLGWGLRHVISDLLSHYAFDAHNDQVVSRGAMRMHAEGNSALRTEPFKGLPVAEIIFQIPKYDTHPINIVSPVGLFNSRFSW